MTIEEWLRSEISGRKSRQLADGWMMTDHAYEYHEGYIAALEEILSKLPEMEHEVTLREVSEMCGDCSNCPYPVSPADPAGCYFDDVPGKWPVYDIQKRVKEKTNE